MELLSGAEAMATTTRHQQEKGFVSPPKRPKIGPMLIFTAGGPLSVDERDVIAVYRNDALGGYCNATVIMASGEEISGCALVAAIDRIEREIADHLWPPEAA
jgi:hypothetical protein